METPKPMAGTWTLTAPDGREWKAETPLRCCGLEQRERVPADVALARILAAAKLGADDRDSELLQAALYALEYHTEQTRPIQSTNDAIAALRKRLLPNTEAQRAGTGPTGAQS
jgi:hypothetical protein